MHQDDGRGHRRPIVISSRQRVTDKPLGTPIGWARVQEEPVDGLAAG